MARIGYYLGCVGCTILSIILFSSRANGSIRGDCPAGCECKFDEKIVKCTYGNWNELPRIPRWAEQVHIEGGNFHTLKNPKACHNYREVITLRLRNNSINIVNNDSLICMPKLQSLTIEHNPVTNLPNETFQQLPHLRAISITDTLNFSPYYGTNFVPKLCTSPQLEEIILRETYYFYDLKSIDCFRNFDNLTHVDLSDNLIIENITHRDLEPLQNVSYFISLKGCLITTLTSDIFAGFRLEILDLSKNLIKYIPRYTFSELTNLKTLDLSNNGITDIQEWFQELPAHISLSGNKLTEPPPITSNMEELYLGGNDFFSLFIVPSSNLSNLRKLDLSSCGINFIGSYAFYYMTALETLNVSNNNIRDTDLSNLLRGVLSARIPLRTLDLSGNHFYLLNGTFHRFQPNQLEKLYLRSCSIFGVRTGTFANFSKLHTLDLSYNRLTVLLPRVFTGLTMLTHLYLEHNNLEYLDLTELGSVSLVELHAQHNRIKHLQLHNTSTLTVLDLSQNDLGHFIHLGYSHSVKKLNLSSQGDAHLLLIVFSFPSNIPLTLDFNPFAELKSLDFSGLEVVTQNETVWSAASQLRQLFIVGCDISALTPRMFSTLQHLDELDASSNHIPFIEPSAFMNVTSLQKLYLDSNEITHVNWDSFVNLPNLTILSLAKNPILCTCQVLWILQAVSTNHLVHIRHQDQLLCQGPSDVVSFRVRDLELKLSDCEDNWLHILKPLSALFFSALVFLLMYVAWHYRWHLRYTLFLARASRRKYEDVCDGGKYTYDAFVAYSSADLPWVKKQLMYNIDVNYVGAEGFKLCIHDRDWLVGVDIVENIVKSIAESRRTILVLTKAFAASRWCQFALAMAHMRLDAECRKRDRLLVILLNEIPAELLTPRLIYFLTTKAYLAWPEDPDQQKAFWKTLRKSLRREILYTQQDEDVQEDNV